MSKTQTVSITGRRMFASTPGRAKLFTPMNSSPAKIYESVARLLRQPTHGFGCVAHKRIYSQWLQRYMMPSVFCSYPGKKCHSNPKETPLVRLFLKAQLENKPLTSSKNAVPAGTTPPWKQTYSCLKDVQFFKLRTQPEQSFFHSETDCFNMSGHEVKLYSCFLAG